MLPQAIATRKHPHRHHGREVERRDADADADGLAQRPVVDAAADVVAELAFQQLRNAARELDDLEPARELAFGVGEHLAVLARDQRGQLVEVRVEQLLEAEHARARASAAACRPSRQRCFGCGHRARDDGGVGERSVPIARRLPGLNTGAERLPPVSSRPSM